MKKTVAVIVAAAAADHIDFEIVLDGQGDGNLYRQYKGEAKFCKLLGLPGNWSKAVRGNVRKAAQELVNNMLRTGSPMGIVEL